MYQNFNSWLLLFASSTDFITIQNGKDLLYKQLEAVTYINILESWGLHK